MKRKEVKKLKGDIEGNVMDKLQDEGFINKVEILEYIELRLKPTKIQIIRRVLTWILGLYMFIKIIYNQVQLSSGLDDALILEMLKIIISP